MGKKMSVIIPCYNTEAVVHFAINSVLSQIHDDTIEIIVVNDGSTDSTLDILNTIKKRNESIIRVISTENQGVSSARNLGLSIAQGQYVLFLDSDDRIKSNVLVDWLDFTSKNDLDISFGGIEIYALTEPDTPIGIIKNIYPHSLNGETMLINKLFHKLWICTGNALYRRELLVGNNIWFDNKYKYGEDSCVFGKAIINASKIQTLNNIVLEAYERGESAMHSLTFEKYLDAFAAYEDLRTYVESKISTSSIRRAFDYDYLNLYLSFAKILIRESPTYKSDLFDPMGILPKPSFRLFWNKKSLEGLLFRYFPKLYHHIALIYYGHEKI